MSSHTPQQDSKALAAKRQGLTASAPPGMMIPDREILPPGPTMAAENWALQSY